MKGFKLWGVAAVAAAAAVLVVPAVSPAAPSDHAVKAQIVSVLRTQQHIMSQVKVTNDAGTVAADITKVNSDISVLNNEIGKVNSTKFDGTEKMDFLSTLRDFKRSDTSLRALLEELKKQRFTSSASHSSNIFDDIAHACTTVVNATNAGVNAFVQGLTH